MATEDALEISSRAMTLISADNVIAFTDGTAEAQVASAFYESTVRSALTEHRWNFASTQGQASQEVAPPTTRFAKSYVFPAPILSIDLITPSYIDYELFAERKIYTDYDGELFVEGVFRVDETSFPQYFTEYLEYRLAAKFAFPITADKALSKEMAALARNFQKLAKSADSKQRKGVGFKKFPLIQVRG
ncbi:hypothetical protein KAR91_54475 [Candidatus Pacearchaeota archaeon]|nr:hypothetical protein [Candidatus Pacearchaeota archaeon]